MNIIDNNAKLAGVLAVSMLVLTLTLTHQSPTSTAMNQYYEDASIERSYIEPVESTWYLRQPRIGSLIEDEDDVKQIVNTLVYSDGQESTADPEGIMWMQMAIDNASLLQDSKGTSVSKHEFAHGLNMPWKITGTL